jgi:4-diphosphocytidyl-2-C-methyl-D-erythritol kinase
MAATRVERAHAKLNLILRILAREAAGYHGLETLFQRLALHDVVTVAITPGIRALHCEGPARPPGGLGPDDRNLAWRAAVAYQDAADWPDGFSIDIEKHIPVGGGLGGGSADAAAVLRALDAMAPAPLGLARLIDIGGTLGADVPFLVAPDALAWGWSRGDRLLPIPSLPPMAVTLVTSRDGVNTGAAYGAIAAARADTGGGAPPAVRLAPDAFRSWDTIAQLATNDFESVVPSLHPGVATVLPVVRRAAQALQREGHAAIGLMSGSGATCFVLHPEGVTPPLGADALPDGAHLLRTRTLGG